MMAFLIARHEMKKIFRNTAMARPDKDAASNEVVRKFKTEAVYKWPTVKVEELGDLLRRGHATGIEFISEETVDQEGNGFSVDRSQIGPLCEVLGLKLLGQDALTRFKHAMKACELRFFGGNEHKIFCYHKFIHPGGEELAKSLTLSNRISHKDLEVYEKIPLGGFVRNKEADAQCEFATNPETIVHSY